MKKKAVRKYKTRQGRLFSEEEYKYLDSAQYLDSLDKTFGKNAGFRRPYDLGWVKKG